MTDECMKSVLTPCAEALDSCKKVENQLVSLTAVGIEIEEEAMQEASSTCQANQKRTSSVPQVPGNTWIL